MTVTPAAIHRLYDLSSQCSWIVGAKSLGLSFFLAWIARAIYNAYLGPLAKLPVAHWSSRLVRWYYTEHDVYDLHKLHQRQGPLVRYGPNEVSVASWDAYKTVYVPTNSPFLKYKSYYSAFLPDPQLWNVFTQVDPAIHKSRRAVMSPLFSRASLLSMEHLFRTKADKVLQKMVKRTAAGLSNNTFYAFRCMTADVITPLAWGQCMNALDERDDFMVPFLKALDSEGEGHILHKRQTFPKFFYYLTLIFKVIPSLAPPTLLEFSKLGKAASDFFDDFVKRRQELKAASPYPILFDLLLDTGTKGGDPIKPALAHAEALNILVAGADTTGHTLSGTCWALAVGYPETGKRLAEELAEALPHLEDIDTFSIQDMEKLPYLSACVREGIRYCDAGNGMLPRVVPHGGTVLDGTYLPSGTIVSSSSVFIHRSEDIFPDAMAFKPERWLDDKHNFSTALDTYLCQFGKGARQCIGKNLAICEIYVTLCTIFRKTKVLRSDGTPERMIIDEHFVGSIRGGDMPLDFAVSLHNCVAGLLGDVLDY